MKIAIRVDASTAIGSGHVMRCATLAANLQQRGARVTFICRQLAGNYCDWLEGQGYHVRPLAAPKRPCGTAVVAHGDVPHSGWLEVSLAEEMAESSRILAEGFDWLIVDHYALDAAWETAMRPHVNRIMVVDDLADRAHAADLLVDQNLQSCSGRYDGLLPAECSQLLGPVFAMIRPEFAVRRASMCAKSGSINRALLFLSGVDRDNHTSRFLEAWGICASGVFLDVVAGDGNPHLSELRARCAQLPDCRLHVQTSEMAELMAQADLMIGGAGSTTWERCCLGLPSVLVSIADNQRDIGHMIGSARAACYLGDAENVSVDQIVSVLLRVFQRPTLVRAMARRARRLVDGRGVDRVAAALTTRLTLTVVSDADSWVNAHLTQCLRDWTQAGHTVRWIHEPEAIEEGDCAFFLSCGHIVGSDILARNTHNLVVHASPLPKGRGWSPMTWQILEGKNVIPITLLEAAERVDSGAIYLQETVRFAGHELVDELRFLLAKKTVELCQSFIAEYPAIAARAHPQIGMGSIYPRRRPQDSMLDSDMSLRSQFNLLRVVDNDRYPAFFEIDGHRYKLKIEKD